MIGVSLKIPRVARRSSIQRAREARDSRGLKWSPILPVEKSENNRRKLSRLSIRWNFISSRVPNCTLCGSSGLFKKLVQKRIMKSRRGVCGVNRAIIIVAAFTRRTSVTARKTVVTRKPDGNGQPRLAETFSIVRASGEFQPRAEISSPPPSRATLLHRGFLTALKKQATFRMYVCVSSSSSCSKVTEAKTD